MDNFKIVFTGLAPSEIIACVMMVLGVIFHIRACIVDTPDFNVPRRSLFIGIFFVVAVLTSIIEIVIPGSSQYASLAELAKEALKYVSVFLVLLRCFAPSVRIKSIVGR